MIRKINPVYASYASSTGANAEIMSNLMKYGSTRQVAQLIGVISYPIKEITKEEVESMIEQVKEDTQDIINLNMDKIIEETIPEEVEVAIEKALEDEGIIEEKIKKEVNEAIKDIIPKDSIITPDSNGISSLQTDANGHIVATYKEIATIDSEDEALII